MIRIPKANFAALALFLAAACQPAAPPVAAGPDPLIAKVESGLAGRMRVLGEPIETWTLAERMAFHHVPGVSIAVIRDGKIAWAKGYGVLEAGKQSPIDPDTIFQAGSISKPTAAIAALRMVEQGRLSLDAPVNDFLKSWKVPDNEFTKKQAVTLRQIMSHGAGFTVHGFPGYAAGKPVPTVPQVLDGAPPANTPAVRVDKLPGESWRYSGGGYTIMQLAMTDVSGQDFPALTDELVLKPAGMARSSYLNPLPEANRANAATAHRGDGSIVPGHSHTYPEMAAAGLWTTPSDLARLALSVIASAKGEPGALLSPDTTRQMLTTQIGNYGLGFALVDAPDGQAFQHGGSDEGFEAVLFSYSDGRGGAAIMTNGQNGGRLSQEIVASIADAYGWKFGAPEERTAIALTPERAAEFAGDYVAVSPGQPSITLTISAEGDRLWVEAPPMVSRQRFYVASDTEVFAATSPILKLRTDDKGKPQAIEINRGSFAERKK
jgi:CubicO group peptidase (beta-lactamase class C family)